MTSETAAAASRRTRGSRPPAIWILGVGVTATILGMTVAVYRGDGSSINAFLFLDLGFSHEVASQIERVALATVAFLALISLAWPRWFVLVPVAAYVLLEAVARYHMGGHAFSELAPAAHSLRYLAPLALVLLASSTAADSKRLGASASDSESSQTSGASRSRITGMWLLRLGLATVFLTHGYEALRLHPGFIDLVITSAENLLGMRIEEAAASTALRVIGVVDMVVAALLIVRPWRPVLVWMAFWGLVTAASRMTSYGWVAHTDFLIRFTHFTAPLALLLMVARRSPVAGQSTSWRSKPATPGATTTRSSGVVAGDSPIAE